MWCSEHNARINEKSGLCEADMSNMGYQRLATTNDTNGNPRRLYAIIGLQEGNMVAVVDEGYLGRQAVDEAGFLREKMVELPSFEITPGSYRQLLRDWQGIRVHN